MSKLTFVRICVVSAIPAGVLRAISSFIPDTTPKIHVLYFAIDLFLLFGVIGLFRLPATRGRILERLGLVVMLLAILILIARDIEVVSPSAYAAGAALFSLGLDLFAIQVLFTRKIPSWIPVSWIVSTIVGAVGFFVPGLHLLFAISGVLFGVGFAAAGVVMWNLLSNTATNSG